jgi:hypothetical protein
MADEKAKKKAAKKVEKAVRKAVKKGVSSELLERAVEHGMAAVAQKKPAAKSETTVDAAKAKTA